MKSGVVIVGLGQIGMGYDLALDPGQYVYSHARAFSQHPKFELLAAVDVDEQRRQTFTSVHGRPAYAELGAALERHQPSVVVVAVPTHLHAATIRQVLGQSNASTILCEKPLANDPAEAREIVAAAARKGVGLYVNYMRRSDRGVIEIRRRIDSGEIGTPVKGVAWYSKGFLHNGSHFFNLLDYWLGPMRSSRVLSRGRLWDGQDPEPDVQVTFARGAVVFLSAWEEAYSHYTVELVSHTGRLRYEQGGNSIQWQPVGPDLRFKGYTRLAAESEVIASGMDRYQWNVAEQLAFAIEGLEAQLSTGADALRTLTDMKSILEWQQS